MALGSDVPHESTCFCWALSCSFCGVIHYRLEIIDLLFSDRGIVYGASYTDVHAALPMLRFLTYFSLLVGGCFIWSGFRRSYKPVIIASGGLLIVSILGRSLYPEFMQKVPSRAERDQHGEPLHRFRDQVYEYGLRDRPG